MRITSKGQVTIPVDIRERAGLRPNSDVDFHYDGKVVQLRPREVSGPKQTRGDRLLAHLHGSADTGLTTDEIMALTRGE